jgi:hypothetical protein
MEVHLVDLERGKAASANRGGIGPSIGRPGETQGSRSKLREDCMLSSKMANHVPWAVAYSCA